MLLVSLGLSILATASCTDAGPVDELAGEPAADQAGDGKADGAVDGTYTYFRIMTDERRCAEPACGGYVLSRLNRSTTVCHDGTTKASCYTPELDWSEANLSVDTQQKLVDAAFLSATRPTTAAIVRGRFAPHSSGKDQPQLGRFIVTEAWVSPSGTPADGVFVKVLDNGVRCIAAPCESLGEKALNESRTASIAAIDYTASELDEAATSALSNAMYQPGGIIIAGDRYTVTESGRHARGRTATAAFQKLVDRATDGCFIGGCSSEICSDEPGAISTCIWHDEYACYQEDTCGRQSDGTCGWDQNDTLAACLGD